MSSDTSTDKIFWPFNVFLFFHSTPTLQYWLLFAGHTTYFVADVIAALPCLEIYGTLSDKEPMIETALIDTMAVL